MPYVTIVCTLLYLRLLPLCFCCHLDHVTRVGDGCTADLPARDTWPRLLTKGSISIMELLITQHNAKQWYFCWRQTVIHHIYELTREK